MRLPELTALAPATLLRSRRAATGQAFVEVIPPAEFGNAYEQPGQFCKIRVAGMEGIFAMFSAPGEPGARFLVRVGNPDGGEAADALAASEDRTPIEMTLPAGEGFELERAAGRDLYFVATGTGIAPIRAALEWVLMRRERYGILSLDHGVRTGDHVAVGEDIERWRRAGVEVRVHFSSPTDGGVRGTTVQDALRARRPDLRNAAVVAVGQPAMLESLLEEVVLLGGDPELFLKNI